MRSFKTWCPVRSKLWTRTVAIAVIDTGLLRLFRRPMPIDGTMPRTTILMTGSSMKKMYLFALCFAMASLPTLDVHAVQSSPKQKLARQLADLMQVKRTASGYLSKCSTLDGSYLDPKRIYALDPNYFGGVSPQSAYWPEIVSTYAKYQAKACQSVTADDYVDFYVREYEKAMTEDELKATVKYFSSPSGRRYNSASIAAGTALQSFMVDKMTVAVGVAFKEAQTEIGAISAKYRKDRR